MSGTPTKTRRYQSRFLFGVDDKRRLQIPAKWLSETEGTELTMVVWPQHEAGVCLRVLPPERMAKLEEDIQAMAKGDKRKIFLKRFIGSNSVHIAVDKAGRISLPEEMAKAAGIRDKAWLVGILDQFEIWSEDRYEKAKVADSAIEQEAFGLME